MVRPYIFDPVFSDIAGSDDGFLATLTRVDGMVAGIIREEPLEASIALASVFTASMIRVDAEDPHYLEVSPEVAWVEASDVLAKDNGTWK